MDTESFLSHPNANICTPSMEINITAVSPARRHSTKHAPCWQKTLLCHVAALETILTLPCFLLFSHHADFLLVVGIMTVFPALEVQFFTCLLADVWHLNYSCLPVPASPCFSACFRCASSLLGRASVSFWMYFNIQWEVTHTENGIADLTGGKIKFPRGCSRHPF